MTAGGYPVLIALVIIIFCQFALILALINRILQQSNLGRIGLPDLDRRVKQMFSGGKESAPERKNKIMSVPIGE